MNKNFWLGIAAYVIPSFPLGYVWHLVLFAQQYQALQIYRPDIIIPFGLLAMLIQGAVLSWLYGRLFASPGRPWLTNGFKFAAIMGGLAWTFLVLTVAAKNIMTSVPLFLMLETGFTALQYMITGPLMALAWSYRKN